MALLGRPAPVVSRVVRLRSPHLLPRRAARVEELAQAVEPTVEGAVLLHLTPPRLEGVRREKSGRALLSPLDEADRKRSHTIRVSKTQQSVLKRRSSDFDP